LLASLQAWAVGLRAPGPAGPVGPMQNGRPDDPGFAAAHGANRLQRGACILVAEDAPSQLRLVSAYLTKAGYRAVGAATGAEAVALVGRGGIDLVLMDVRMPGLNGLAATRLIRALPPPAGMVPIVALTAEAGEADRKLCLATGMTDFLAKPVDPERLLGAVRAALEPTGGAGRRAA
jgi:hypothetical protein